MPLCPITRKQVYDTVIPNLVHQSPLFLDWVFGALFEDMVVDDEMPDLQDCSDDKNEDDEDDCLTEEEFDQNQALANADHNMNYPSV